ncbi:outer membrane protein assembly factor BamE [Polynucleobacter arcticus]|uniref:Outer membrane protein assembly factor BamE n=2 Tax=Polynucleobacter arcticus TaxID=1743165 RepID=A0A6M9PH80_9BURK|nr:outer membrane protein assembly factor BamE [Polynucleobacter arcticus]
MQNCLRLFMSFFYSISGIFRHIRSGFLIALIGGALSLAGCTSAVDDTQRAWMNKVFRPYVPDVVQGNFISSEQYAKLQVGQSREQVRQILGTPLLASYFHANRWDYVFEFKRANQVMGKERRVTVFFEGDKLVKFQGDALPTDVELVAEIDGYAKTKRSFWDVVTGSNKPPVTIPLQQPELLVPSPTNNLPAGASPAVPAASTSSSFWDFFSFSKKSPETQSPQLGPGSLNIPQASEAK